MISNNKFFLQKGNEGPRGNKTPSVTQRLAIIVQYIHIDQHSMYNDPVIH